MQGDFPQSILSGLFGGRFFWLCCLPLSLLAMMAAMGFAVSVRKWPPHIQKRQMQAT
jgi:hypothetical protein